MPNSRTIQKQDEIKRSNAKLYKGHADYNQKHYYPIYVRVPLSKKGIIMESVKKSGTSLNKWVTDALEAQYGIDLSKEDKPNDE